MLRPLLDLLIATGRLRGHRAGHDLRHVLGLRHRAASPRRRRRDVTSKSRRGRHSRVGVHTGTFFCGECKPQLARRACAADADRELKERGWGACPACRAPLRASHSENVKRLERLLVTRTEGKHVARVQYKLGLAYELGRGAVRDSHRAPINRFNWGAFLSTYTNAHHIHSI